MKALKIVLLLAFPILGLSQKIQVLDLSGQWKFTIGDREEYVLVDYDDSDWERIRVPASWENEGFANYNGYAWYRFSFDGYDLKGFKNLIINLGYIDDTHEAYLNGKLIGFNGSFPPDFYTSYDALNEYNLPESAINRNGKNVLAIKVYDLVKDGGIVKGHNIGIWFKPEMQEDFFNLAGVWKFTQARTSRWNQEDIDDSDWGNILVPSHWRSKHIKNSRGTGWYRTEFRLPDHLKGQDLYLILGLIDDFDLTYVNGKIVGRTKDYRPYGSSRSYEEFRVYKISREDLNQSGLNVIAVQVEDIGGMAGIYQGPIGLTSRVSSRDVYKH